MDDSDKMTALKKAYAEIILNTAKEGAARVIMSERKAVRLENDLKNAKDEALRLLVRLKEMINAKTIEAEIESSNQKKRIEELEAQLLEAEDIITDLRSQLNWAKSKLEKAGIDKSNSLNAMNEVEDIIYTQKSETRNKEFEGILSTYTDIEDYSNRRCTVLALRAKRAEVIKKAPDAFGAKKTSKARKSRRRRMTRWRKQKASSLVRTFYKTSMEIAEGEEDKGLQPKKCSKNIEQESDLAAANVMDHGLTLMKDVDPISGPTNVTADLKPVEDEDLGSRNKDLVVKCENQVAQSTEINAISDEIYESPEKADGNRVFKFTFQRKRKRGSLSDNNGNISPAKKKMEGSS